MDVIDTICDERLALTDILTERQQHLLHILRNIKAAMESLNILEEEYKRCRC